MGSATHTVLLICRDIKRGFTDFIAHIHHVLLH